MKQRIVLTVGYFDWFSGYQEVVLASALSPTHDVTVITSDRVNPIFQDAHLAALGKPRRYRPGRRDERGVTIHRLPSTELRAMVWSTQAAHALSDEAPNLVIAMMPGQLLPYLASRACTSPMAVIFGDNAAMYAHHTAPLQKAKWAVFLATKALIYRRIAQRASVVYGYTPNTISRLRGHLPIAEMKLLPLSFDHQQFFYSDSDRTAARAELGVADDQLLLVAPGKPSEAKRLGPLAAGLRKVSDPRRVRLLLVGGDESTYERLIQPYLDGREADQVITKPFVDAQLLNRLFNAADCGIWPRQPAITIQQALATGLPVLIPRNDYVSHLLAHDMDGWFRGDKESDDDLINSVWKHLQTDPKLFSLEERVRRAERAYRLSGSAVADQILNDLRMVAQPA